MIRAIPEVIFPWILDSSTSFAEIHPSQIQGHFEDPFVLFGRVSLYHIHLPHIWQASDVAVIGVASAREGEVGNICFRTKGIIRSQIQNKLHISVSQLN